MNISHLFIHLSVDEHLGSFNFFFKDGILLGSQVDLELAIFYPCLLSSWDYEDTTMPSSTFSLS